MEIITVDKSAMKCVLKMLGYDVKKVNVNEIAGICKEGLIKKDIVSLIRLSDKLKAEK